MAKKKPGAVDTSDASPLRHNPFAALASSPTPAAEAPPPSSAQAEPSAPVFSAKVVVRREKAGRGGKTVTRISGLGAAHREGLAGRMKKALGCGAAVEGDDVLLLGSLVDRAADWLEAEGAKRVVRSA